MAMSLADKTFLEQAGLQILLAASVVAKKDIKNSLTLDGINDKAEIEALLREALNPELLSTILSDVSNYISVKLDLAQLQSVVVRSQPNSLYNQKLIIRELILCHATLPMMKSLYGLTRQEFKALRAKLGVSNNEIDMSGRPAKATFEEELAILDEFRLLLKANPDAHLGVLLLDIYRKTGVNLKTVWWFLCKEVFTDSEFHKYPGIARLSDEVKAA